MNDLVHYSLQDNVATIRKKLVRKLRISAPLDLIDAALIGLRGKSQ